MADAPGEEALRRELELFKRLAARADDPTGRPPGEPDWDALAGVVEEQLDT